MEQLTSIEKRLHQSIKPDDERFFIELLKYGSTYGLKGCSFKNIIEWARENNYLPEEEHLWLQKTKQLEKSPTDFLDTAGMPHARNLLVFYLECFHKESEHDSFFRLDYPYPLKTEYYFRLVEFRELELARKASKEARRFSIAAIIISLIALLVAWLNPIRINEEQLSRIIGAMPYKTSCTDPTK